jgi:hypothetical protein
VLVGETPRSRRLPLCFPAPQCFPAQKPHGRDLVRGASPTADARANMPQRT